MKKLLVFQHLACEGPGRFLEFAESRGVILDVIHFLEGGKIPSDLDYAALLVLGGSMNVYEEDQYPWLEPETRLIKDWVTAGRPYLGLCLGGQLLAKAMGGRVTKNPRKEIGNFSVRLTEEGRKDPLFTGLPSSFSVFQWHGDTFSELGSGVKLAESDWCANQAFRWGTKAYGLQFHSEVTSEMAHDWLHEFNPELLEENLDPKPISSEFLRLEADYRHQAEVLFSNFFELASI